MGLDLHLKHLEYFMTVAQLGSINKAAQKHYISQPYLGKIIKDLENAVGTILFQRTRGGVVLTPDGEDFMSHAENILKETEKMQHFSNSASASEESLIVSMTKYSHIMECFNDVVIRYGTKPAFMHRLNEGTPEEVIEDVYTGQANIGVFHFDSREHSEMKARLARQNLNYRFLCYLKPHILISKNHPLILNREPVNLRTLASYGFVRYMGECEDFTYRIFSENAQYNLNYGSRIVYIDGRASLLHLICNSDFYSIGIHDFSVQTSAYQVLSIPIEDCSDRMEFGYIVPAKTEVSDITQNFIDVLTSRLKN